jgi:quercetin dioxygenase-like cupin family protein
VSGTLSHVFIERKGGVYPGFFEEVYCAGGGTGVSTLNLPYQWTEIQKEQINPLLLRQAIHGDGMTVARLEMSTGCVVPLHSHHNEQISMVERG